MEPEGVQYYEVQPLPRPIVGLTRVTAVGGAVMMLVWIAIALVHGEFAFAVEMLVGIALFLSVALVIYRFRPQPDGLETALVGNELRLVWRGGQSLPSRRTIHVNEITRLAVVDYYPVVDGEWGAREGKAIQIILRGGDEVRLGTARPEALLAALQAARDGATRQNRAGTDS